jgi:uncharacterized protein YecT (DUF1311 family)
MRNFVLAIVLLSTPLAYAAVSCRPAANDAEEHNCEFEKSEKVDQNLNAVYERLFNILDDEGKVKLAEAQSAWRNFQDANASFSADFQRGGTAVDLIRLWVKTDVARARIKELRSEYRARKPQ